MAKNLLKVKLNRTHAMRVTRVSISNKKKLVYVIVADKALRYPWGRSRIAYIGTTKKGAARFAQSAADKAEHVLNLYGLREIQVRVLTCAARQNVKTWLKLERVLILTFRERYGAVPRCNTIGKKFKRKDEGDHFAEKRIKEVLSELEQSN